MQAARTHALWLAFLAFVFLLRVVGQILVALGWAPWLPPMEAWYSGLLDYPPLLASQFVILVLQVWIVRDLWRGEGVFAPSRPALGRLLWWFGWVYLVVMVICYVLTREIFDLAWMPEMRGTIPIYFHWVLAAWVLIWAHWNRQSVP